jgi:thioredoxin reductase (NADPH)
VAKPVILAVDDDPGVLRAVERDLRDRYARDHRILRADSGDRALEALRRLSLRAQPVALLLVDQRMPGMSGVELLERAREWFPETKRVLLTAYADTTAAIAAINDARLDYYLLKPWDPPSERLYPVLDDLLADWQRTYHPPFEGLRVVGNRWSPDSYAVRDFLERNLVPYRWHDIASRPGAELVERAQADPTRLPLVVFPDGTLLQEPGRRELAERAGLRTAAERPFYDLIVVGAGPAGLAAAVYGSSEGLRTLLVEAQAPGGQAGTSARIENYLGFPDGLSGRQLTERATAQARRLGAEMLASQVTAIRADDTYRLVTLDDGTELSCHVLLLTVGLDWRTLDVPGIAELTGRGVYYGSSMVQARECSGEDVYLVGGGNSAGQAALAFADNGATTVLLVRGTSLDASMSRYLIDQIEARDSITVRYCTTVVGAAGSDHLESLELADARTGERETVPAGRLFLFIGAVPQTDWIGGLVRTDPRGFLLTGPDLAGDDGLPPEWPLERPPLLLETSVPGVFAAGDVRLGSVKRVASGVGEGAMAVQLVHEYLKSVR